MLPRMESVSGLRSYSFHQRNSCGVAYTTSDGGVVASWEACNDGRFSGVHGRMTAAEDFLDLIVRDNPAYYRRMPIIVGRNQSARTVMPVPMSNHQSFGTPNE